MFKESSDIFIRPILDTQVFSQIIEMKVMIGTSLSHGHTTNITFIVHQSKHVTLLVMRKFLNFWV